MAENPFSETGLEPASILSMSHSDGENMVRPHPASSSYNQSITKVVKGANMNACRCNLGRAVDPNNTNQPGGCTGLTGLPSAKINEHTYWPIATLNKRVQVDVFYTKELALSWLHV